MTSSGRWRRTLASARTGSLLLVLSGLVWCGWSTSTAFRQDVKAIPAEAKKVPIKHIELRTADGGVLDNAWLAQALALPKGISLVELELEKLRQKLLADGQLVSASLTRVFPDKLIVYVAERSPVARIKVATEGGAQTMLVARDGVVYSGSNYERAMLETLPWLAGFSLKPDGAGFKPIPEMDIVADLLARGQYEAPHLYRNWRVVSLDRLSLDRELEITMRSGACAVFTVKTDFFPQLAKLDHILLRLADPARFPAERAERARIDLTLGREVAVTLDPLLATDRSAKPALTPGFNVLSPSR